MVLRSTMSRLLAVLIVSIFTAVVSPPAHAATEKPCCEITAIDGRANTATARDLATGRVFQFVTPKAATTSALKVGQRIFANFAANMVSLDGVKQCCKIIPAAATTPAIPAAASKTTVTPSQTATAATSPQPKTTTSSTGKTVSTIKPTEAMMPPIPSMSAGVPRLIGQRQGIKRLSMGSTASNSSLSSNLVHVRGIEGIKQAQGLPEGAKDLLILHASTLPPEEIDHYIVNRQLAAQWMSIHPAPASAHKSSGNTHSGCHALSMHCASEAAQHAEGEAARQSEKLREEATKEWRHVTSEAAHDWHMAEDCFADHTLHLGDVPVQFSISPEFPLSMTQSGSTDLSHGTASGQVTGTVTIGLPLQADFMAQVDVFYIPCLPFAVRPKRLSADGAMTVASKLGATLDASGKFKESFMIPPGGGPYFPVEVIPIVIAGVPVAELDAGVYVDGTVDVWGDGKLHANFQLEAPHKSAFFFDGSGKGITAREHGVPVPTTTSEAVKVDGRVWVKPAIYAALQLDFDVDALTARAGPQPYLLGELAGCAFAAGTQTTGGGSTAQESHGLTADLDWSINLRAEALAGGQKVGTFSKKLMPERHLYFRDLIGSTSLVAAVDGPTQVSVGKPAVFKIKMPTCYPYTEQVEYRLTWTGGATAGGSSSTSSTTKELRGLKTSTSSTQTAGCAFQVGQADCWSDPFKDTTVTLVWPAAGSYTLSATAERDKHGREFSAPKIMQLAVNVQ
jgi:hypothetical protein